ncbi:MAG: type II secretion system ATPase GspE [Gammaproteobacteria bacterium]|nr:type II secretion system ATPase GspE [Gammaproteobacteria bacterium]
MAELKPKLNQTYNLSYNFAIKHGVILKNLEDDQAQVACLEKICAPEVLSELNRYLNVPLEIEILSKEDFNNLLNNAYSSSSSDAKTMMADIEDDIDLSAFAQQLPSTQDLLASEDDAPVIRLINVLLTQAIKQDASDIHIETYEDKIIIRFRIDGILRVVLEPQRALAPIIISRIKVMAKLDIAEKRLPQDGRIGLRVAGREVDLRVSTMPTTYGERIVMRILDKQSSRLDLAQLGMNKKILTQIHKLLENPFGILLVTGPTGSGKTTTLYSMLSVLNQTTRNILTVEDPVEYNLEGIGQTQVNTKVEMTFAKGLRAILRQDPDIVMVGEIRDLETVEVSIQASLTGHLVLSTLHTNTAIGAITRLRDMGVEPFLLSSSVIGVLAQRLVRLLCRYCMISLPADPATCDLLGIDPSNPPMLNYPGNYSNNNVLNANKYFCEHCGSTGFMGRSGIYELAVIDDQMQQLIHQGASEQELEREARKTNQSMSSDGIKKVLAGLTSVEEVLRVITIEK